VNEVGKMLLSLLVIAVPILCIPFCYAVYRAWKIVRLRRYLERYREERR